ncbi:hypothetical protein PV08_02304 [Exophiala spinifera]|uniref:Major facilitator superfamily (MFS) profile domain-containing protein n=1 Tax=Exophiala spinifera TaxID=91928 RepID=A0A0D1ZZD1_9EURO|nr:uncharacterized protein PV08_02304 [Exophiala spinifera]KIW18017.1 hypothetical protein PV08_02304 [Exophiala spinifera]
MMIEKNTDTDSPQREAEMGVEQTVDVSPNVSPRSHIAPWRWVTTCIALYLGALLYGLDTTIAADVQAQVYEDLGHIDNLQWVGLGFPMASAATILTLTRAYGLFNVKTLVLSSVFVFEVGSAVCGSAPSSNALVIGRVIAGIGGAGMYLGALTYISAFTKRSETPLYNALIGLSWGVGSILGPVVGGALSVSSATWRWAFYINLPLAAILSPVYFLLFPSRNPRPDLTLKEKLSRIDWVGASLNAAVFVLFMVALSFGGSTYAWDSAGSIALWVVFGVCLIAYILQQAFSIFTTDEDRIFPVHFLRSRTLVLLYFATGGAGAAQAITLYYTPLFFQFTRGDSALRAAVRLLPFICTYIFFVMAAGGSLPLIGRYNLYYIVGGSLVVIGSSLLFTIDTNISSGNIYGYEVLAAAGIGLAWQNAYSVATVKVSSIEEVPKALGFINLAQIGTVAISLAIGGSLFHNLGYHELKHAFAEAGYHFPNDYIRSALAGRISPVFASADEDIIHIAIEAVAETIRKMFGQSIAAGALIIVSSLLMKFEKISLGIAAAG